MSDQTDVTVAETPAETNNETTLKKAIRKFAKYPSTDNYEMVCSIMRVMQRAYVADLNAKFAVSEK